MDTDQIIENIWKQQDQILSNLNFEDIAVYIFLKNEYSKGNILNNFVFQYVFKSYLRIDNAGWSDKMKKQFFILLSEKQSDLKTILLKLYKIPTLRGKNSIQFSFATKLLHTINNDSPIFDSMVSKIIKMDVKGNNKNEKINSCIKIQNYLKDLYKKLITDTKIQQVISNFRTKFSVQIKEMSDKKIMSDTKILDSIIWSLGKNELKK
jgi:hypothetical protein